MITDKKTIIIGFALLLVLAGAVFVCEKQNGESRQPATNKTAIANQAANEPAKNDLSVPITTPLLPEDATVQDYVDYFKKTGADLNNNIIPGDIGQSDQLPEHILVFDEILRKTLL